MPIVATTRSSIRPNGAVDSTTTVTVTGVTDAGGGSGGDDTSMEPPVHVWPKTAGVWGAAVEVWALHVGPCFVAE